MHASEKATTVTYERIENLAGESALTEERALRASHFVQLELGSVGGGSSILMLDPGALSRVPSLSCLPAHHPSGDRGGY
jgi:hypothetical protein